MADPFIPIQTIRYKTYVKEALVEGLSSVFENHADPFFQGVKVGIDFPVTQAAYPSIVVRFYERQIKNAGVSHEEYLETSFDSGRYIKYQHYLYNGDIEFAIYALSSYDRDLLADSLVQIIAMGRLEPYTNQFLTRIYSPDVGEEPTSIDHMINLNTDVIQGFGETQQIAPWMPEDVLVYQTSYRIGIFGEFYSRTPGDTDYGMVHRIEQYPYIDYLEAVPTPDWSGPDNIQGTTDDEPDPALWD